MLSQVTQYFSRYALRTYIFLLNSILNEVEEFLSSLPLFQLSFCIMTLKNAPLEYLEFLVLL